MKARITITFEYDLVSDYYPENSSPEEWIQIDVANFRSDISNLFLILEDSELEISGKLIKDGVSS